MLLVAALIIQIILAGFTIWTKKAVLPTTAHVATGALMLGTSLVLGLRTHRFLEANEHQSHEIVLAEQTAA